MIKLIRDKPHIFTAFAKVLFCLLLTSSVLIFVSKQIVSFFELIV